MDEKHKEIGGYGDNCLQCHADGKKPKDGAETRQPGPIVAAGTTGGSEAWAGLLLIGNVAIGLGLRRMRPRC